MDTLFYAPQLTKGEQFLDQDESRHCVKVLRLAEGDEIQIVDGKGGFYKAVITRAHPKKCVFEIREEKRNYGKRDFHLHIAIAPTKNNDRFEWFLEKATEIGVDQITPVICEHSERRVYKTKRGEKKMVAAMKQSMQSFLPQLNNPVDLGNFLSTNLGITNKFIAHCLPQNKEMLKDVYQAGKDALILIGPEGDFSEAEIELALENEFQPVSLGNTRLRTETAGVVACHTINLLNKA